MSHFIPPVSLSPPEIEASRLKELLSSEELRAQFPPKSIFKERSIISPIHNASMAKLFFRAVFRLNKDTPGGSAEHQKIRVSLAFDALRSLNELTGAIETLEKKRALHIDRNGVTFGVGQVVKHKVEQWRGVITGWHHHDKVSEANNEPTRPTSLTMKMYSLDPVDSVKYKVLLDSGDVHMHYYPRRHELANASNIHQSDLELVEDESLLRIRNPRTKQFFKRFDADCKRFIPNDVLAYEYPNDFQISESPNTTIYSEEAADQLISGIQEASDHLRRIILDYTSAPESRQLKLLALFLDRLTRISNGDVLPIKDLLASEEVSKTGLAAWHLKEFTNVAEEIGDLVWRRRRSLECDPKNKFSVGDILRHTKYGFRGVVVGWDPTPTVDVSRWDGLTHIQNPEQYPFYHIIPDQMDCLQAFGVERPSRYVCEANLEVCPFNERNIDIDLDPVWQFQSSDRVYLPPDDLKFKFGLDLGDDGLTKQCLMELKVTLARIFVALRDSSSSGSAQLDSITNKISTENLMAVLRTAEDMESATFLSDGLKEIMRAHLNGDLRYRLDTAIEDLLGGNVERALALFADLLGEDPLYAEALLRVSTCHLLLGNLALSLEYAKRTMETQPNHFQAQNSLGLLYYEMNDIPNAARSFQKSIEQDPWSPVSTRLSVCRDNLKQQSRSQNTD